MLRACSFGLLAIGLLACSGERRSQPDARVWIDAAPDASSVPYVVTVSPADGAQEAEGDVVVTAAFSEPMDPATINETTFTMTGPGGVVPGTVSYGGWPVAARFRPTTELTKLATYTVTIAAGASDLDGHPMAAPFSWTFTVAEQWWHPPEAIEQVAGEWQPAVACDGGGNLMLVWLQSGQGGNGLWAARRVDGAWESPFRLDPGAGTVIEFQLSAIANGDAIVGWDGQDGAWVRQYQPASGWGAPGHLDSWSVGTSVAINANGDALAAWLGTSDSKAVHYTRSAGWGTPSVISTQSSTGGSPVAIADSGDGLVVWPQTDGAYHAWARAYSHTTGWSSALEFDAAYSFPWGLAMSPSGDAIALLSETTSASELVARRYVVGSGWLDSTVLFTGSDGPAVPQLAMDATGDAIAIWSQEDQGNPTRLLTATYSSTTGVWAPPTTATLAMGAQLGRPVVAIGDSEHAFAAWDENRTSNGDRSIVAAHETPAGLVTSDVEDLDSSQEYSVALAACPGGTAIVVWAESSGLYASEYR